MPVPPRWYLDTSAALKLLVNEAESEALAAAITTANADLCGSRLLETELRFERSTASTWSLRWSRPTGRGPARSSYAPPARSAAASRAPA